MKRCPLAILLILCTALLAQAQTVDNVRFEQRTDGSLLVDIYYDATGTNNLPVEVIVEASEDSGSTWSLPCTSLTGDVGLGITPGTNKHVVWDFFADNPYTSGDGYRVRVTANQDLCGMTITEDLTLTEDLTCPGGTGAPALNIGASGITLDLGGHTIFGDLTNGWIEGVIAQNVDEIIFRNGTIEGFGNGIILSKSANSTFEDLTIRNLDIDDPDIQMSGIVAGESHGVVIRDCEFEFLRIAHKVGITLGNTEATIDNVEFRNGGLGIDFGGALELPGSTGLVVNSRFIDNGLAGILVQYGDGARIVNNVFERTSIAVGSNKQGLNRRLTIEGNNIHDWPGIDAIQFAGGTESVISNNIISNNGKGIALIQSRGCSGDTVGGEECFYPTGNVIRDNVVLGNDIDLHHCEQCTGNTWEGNTFETAQGIEIYTVDPTPARAFLASVDAAAVQVASDAQLLFVSSLETDSLGNSFRWNYVYKSVAQQSQLLFWYHNGLVIYRGSPVWPVGEDHLPLPESWPDSRTAVETANEMGGGAFMEEFGFRNIEMGLSQTHSLVWTVHFFAADTTFTAEILIE